jgi:diaminopimelate decarboxylase
MLHVGADLFLRECYNPQDWPHEIIVADRAGRIKSGLDEQHYVLAGPLCFAGDVLAREIALPKIEAGDWVIIQDTGAYTLSMWSRYNSRQIPKVIGYYQDGATFEILKEREPLAEVLRFWA